MRATILIFTLFVASLASTAPAIAQEGHPLKGSWVGTWGPSKLHDNDLFATTSAWEYVYQSPSRPKNRGS